MTGEIIDAYLQYGVLGIAVVSQGFVIYNLWKRNNELNDKIESLLKNESIENAKNAVVLSNALANIMDIMKNLPSDVRNEIGPKFEEIKIYLIKAINGQPEK